MSLVVANGAESRVSRLTVYGESFVFELDQTSDSGRVLSDVVRNAAAEAYSQSVPFEQHCAHTISQAALSGLSGGQDAFRCERGLVLQQVLGSPVFIGAAVCPQHDALSTVFECAQIVCFEVCTVSAL